MAAASGTTTGRSVTGRRWGPATAPLRRQARSRATGPPTAATCSSRRCAADRAGTQYGQARFPAIRTTRESAPTGVSPCPSCDSMRCVSSPRRIAPAMRALPLNVCSVRRNSATGLPSCGLRRHARNSSPARGNSSAASSRKMGNTCVSTSSRIVCQRVFFHQWQHNLFGSEFVDRRRRHVQVRRHDRGRLRATAGSGTPASGAATSTAGLDSSSSRASATAAVSASCTVLAVSCRNSSSSASISAASD